MSGIKDAFLGDTLERDFIPPFQAHSTTSREAAQSISGHVTRLQQRVLDYLEQHPDGATDEQLGEALSLGGSTLRPRRRELRQAGLVIDSKRYALSKSGRRSTLWVIKPESPQDRGPKLWPPI